MWTTAVRGDPSSTHGEPRCAQGRREPESVGWRREPALDTGRRFGSGIPRGNPGARRLRTVPNGQTERWGTCRPPAMKPRATRTDDRRLYLAPRAAAAWWWPPRVRAGALRAPAGGTSGASPSAAPPRGSSRPSTASMPQWRDAMQPTAGSRSSSCASAGRRFSVISKPGASTSPCRVSRCARTARWRAASACRWSRRAPWRWCATPSASGRSTRSTAIAGDRGQRRAATGGVARTRRPKARHRAVAERRRAACAGREEAVAGDHRQRRGGGVEQQLRSAAAGTFTRDRKPTGGAFQPSRARPPGAGCSTGSGRHARTMRRSSGAGPGSAREPLGALGPRWRAPALMP